MSDSYKVDPRWIAARDRWIADDSSYVERVSAIFEMYSLELAAESSEPEGDR